MSSGSETRILLVRHCEVRNPDGVLYGHLPGFPLSERGVRQAHALGRGLASTGIDTVYTSPLERAQETAAIIASYIEGARIVTTDDLVEAEFGRHLQGVRITQIPWRRPLWLIHLVWPGLLPNDENVASMAGRVRRAVIRAVREHPGKGAICISHGDPIQAFWLQVDGRHPYALHRLQCAKGGMLTLDYEGEQLVRHQYHAPEEMAHQPAGDAPGPSP
jgi:broad specificity phosphatase PhoE